MGDLSELAKRVGEVARLEGDFLLKSGRKSKYYLDIKRAYGFPDLLVELADAVFEIMDPKTTCVVANGYGAVPLASAISCRWKIKLCAIREKEKEHGTGNRLEGYVPTLEDFVSFPDDAFTVGTSFKEARRLITPTNAKIVSYVAVVHRQEGDPSELGAPFNYLFTPADLGVKP